MKVISAIVGIILLSASLILAYLSNHHANEMVIKKDAIVMKYVHDSDKALESGDIKGAIKSAKLAIKADPNTKKGYVCLENAYTKKYKPTDEMSNTTEDSAAPVAMPSFAPPSYDEDDMGC